MTNTESNEGLTLFGSFTSSSSYKPMLYLALARLPFSFRTVNLKYGAQKEADYLAVNRYGQVPALRHRGLTIVQSNVILDYLARTTGHFAGETEQDRWTSREWLSWEADNITNVAKVRHYSRFREVDPERSWDTFGRWPRRPSVLWMRRWPDALGWSVSVLRSLISAAGAGWFSWRREGWTLSAGRMWRHGRSGLLRWRDMPCPMI
jgi:glutathione S-transferase